MKKISSDKYKKSYYVFSGVWSKYRNQENPQSSAWLAKNDILISHLHIWTQPPYKTKFCQLEAGLRPFISSRWRLGQGWSARGHTVHSTKWDQVWLHVLSLSCCFCKSVSSRQNRSLLPGTLLARNRVLASVTAEKHVPAAPSLGEKRKKQACYG